MSSLGILVDDQDKHLIGQLSSKEVLDFDWVPLKSVTKLAVEIVNRNPAILALDYRLDEAPEGLEADEVFKGSALAQHLRDRAVSDPSADFPIVLVSTEEKLEKLYNPDKTAHDLFDRVYRKEKLSDERARIRRELLSLANGYALLIESVGKFDPHKLLKGDPAQEELDFQELRLTFERAEAPHLLSIFILRRIIDTPGILFDEHDVAARLGVSASSFEQVAPLLADAGLSYGGIFSDGWARWWAGRLADWSEEAFGARATSLSAAKRSALLNEKFGVETTPAQSTWNGSVDELISFACCCCQNGTEVRHSLSIFAPHQPKFAVRPRICWDCLQNDRHLHAKPSFVVDESDADLVDYVQAHDRSE